MVEIDTLVTWIITFCIIKDISIDTILVEHNQK